jgi:hypothetical protein
MGSAAWDIAPGSTGRGVHLAEEVFDHWRDRDEAVAAVLAKFLATATDITYPGVRLRELAGCASRIEDPDPELAAAVLPWADHGDGKIASAAIGALARLRDDRCLGLAGRSGETTLSPNWVCWDQPPPPTRPACWKITGQTDPCADVLARHVSAKPAGYTAVATLLAMSRLPRQCLPMVRHLAYAPCRLAFDGFQNGAAHADDVMRDNARALLRLQGP